MHDPQGAHGLHHQKIELIRVRAAASPRNRFQPVDGILLGVFFDKRLVPRVLDLMRDFIELLIPRDIFPIRPARPAHLRFQQPAIIQDILLKRSPLGTQRPAVSRMVGIAFDVDHLRGDILGPIPDRVDDRPATYRAIRTRRPRLISSSDFKDSELRVGRLEVEAENSGGCPADGGELQKVSSGSLHGTPWCRDKGLGTNRPRLGSLHNANPQRSQVFDDRVRKKDTKIFAHSTRRPAEIRKKKVLGRSRRVPSRVRSSKSIDCKRFTGRLLVAADSEFLSVGGSTRKRIGWPARRPYLSWRERPPRGSARPEV